MTIPFRVKKITKTARVPEKANEGDLYDLFIDDFDFTYSKHDPHNGDRREKANYNLEKEYSLRAGDRVLVKTGIAIQLPILQSISNNFVFNWGSELEPNAKISYYAVADIRPRSGLALKEGITVLNTPGTIDNSYRKEIGIILHNTGDKLYKLKAGDKIAQMLIRPLYPSRFEVVEDFEDTARGGFGSTGNTSVSTPTEQTAQQVTSKTEAATEIKIVEVPPKIRRLNLKERREELKKQQETAAKK